jgi:segregation and condensation protein B
MTIQAQQIEALLFLAGDAVARNELARLVGCSVEELENYASELVTQLENHGLSLITTDSHIQLVTSPTVAEYLSKYLADESNDLTAAAAETLAIIAYRAPITRIDLDAIRGVDSRSILRQLVSRGLVRKNSDGDRVPKYVVTEEFMQHMGLRSNKELPDFDQLSSHEKIQELLNKDAGL